MEQRSRKKKYEKRDQAALDIERQRLNLKCREVFGRVIHERNLCRSDLSKEMGYRVATVNNLFNGESNWQQHHIDSFLKILNIDSF